MRRAHRRQGWPFSIAAERPAPNATLRNCDRFELLEHCDRRLRDLIERGDRLGIGRVGLLRHDQLGKLRGYIHVGRLHGAAGDCAAATGSSYSDHSRTLGRARLVRIVANADKPLSVGKGSHSYLPKRQRAAAGEFAFDGPIRAHRVA